MFHCHSLIKPVIVVFGLSNCRRVLEAVHRRSDVKSQHVQSYKKYFCIFGVVARFNQINLYPSWWSAFDGWRRVLVACISKGCRSRVHVWAQGRWYADKILITCLYCRRISELIVWPWYIYILIYKHWSVCINCKFVYKACRRRCLC